MEFAQGWDSITTLVEDRWVERRPRRPEIAAQLRRETRLLPWLAPRLPLPIPVPWVAGAAPLIVRHALVPGAATEAPTGEHGAIVGAFLRALHDSPAEEAVRHGLPPAETTRRERAETTARFRAEVLPLLPPAHRDQAGALLDTWQDFPADTLVHGDLGPEHLLTADGQVTGVIDFGDAHLGDPAIDLAWVLFGAPTAFADAAATAYGVGTELRRRAWHWHQLGPWYEVTYGIDIADPAVQRDGLAGVVARLVLG
ncbi:phosphotransferase [Nocardia sp. NPDC048505]|uniref:phosphotransferase n=1 Tax=unclassified Nocardia TaxID=2637762 RepID=UPI003402957B